MSDRAKISTHDLRGLRRAAKKRSRRAWAKSAAYGPAWALPRDKQRAAREAHYAAAQADLAFRRAEDALCERLGLPWYP
jgi:hypothetical protein